MRSLGLVAHDARKDELLDWAGGHVDRLRQLELYATGTTGGRLLTACPDLTLTVLKSGPLGGDQQLGALIAEGRLDALIFFIDPMAPQPHDVDLKALVRIATLYNIPFAVNRATAEALIRAA